MYNIMYTYISMGLPQTFFTLDGALEAFLKFKNTSICIIPKPNFHSHMPLICVYLLSVIIRSHIIIY